VASILIQTDQAYTSIRTVEEVSYALVRISATRRFGARGIYQVRRIIEKHELGVVERELKVLRELIVENGIRVLPDRAGVEEIHDTMVKYWLLPGDAIIALTCKHHGIDTILTFDEDFKRVPWLKVVP